MLDKRVWSTAKIGDVESEIVGMPLYEFYCPYDLSPQPPIHGRKIRKVHRGDVYKIHGQCMDSDLGQILPNSQIQSLVIQVIGTSCHNHQGFIRAIFTHNFVALFVHLLDDSIMFLQCIFQGLLYFLFGFSNLF